MQLYQSVEKDNQNISIYNGDILSEDVSNHIAINTVDIVITSPPYNVSIDYGSHKDDDTYKDYLKFSFEWLRSVYSLCKDGGRLCVNIPLDKNKNGQQSVYGDFVYYAKLAGWNYHASIVWNEGNISKRTAWGSWKSSSAPYIITPVEMILVMYKGDSWRRDKKGRISDIEPHEFINWTNGLWSFNGEKKKISGHPAAFPRELPKRCLKMFSFVGDTVLDPFCGSGTTLLECYELNRNGIGVDIEQSYCQRSYERLQMIVSNEKK